MAWVRFTAAFDFKPKPALTIAYPSGHVGNVTRDCANAAVKAGKAVRLRKPRRDADPVEANG